MGTVTIDTSAGCGAALGKWGTFKNMLARLQDAGGPIVETARSPQNEIPSPAGRFPGNRASSVGLPAP